MYLDHPVADVRLQPGSKTVKLYVATAVTAMYIVQEHFGSIGNASKSVYAKGLHHAFHEDLLAEERQKQSEKSPSSKFAAPQSFLEKIQATRAYRVLRRLLRVRF